MATAQGQSPRSPQGTMQILSPANGDTLGLQFSVYGTCDAITTASNPPMTVKLMNGTTEVQTQSAVNNPDNKTWEATFNLPPGTTISDPKGASIVVTCGDMSCTPLSGLKIESQSIVTITAPAIGQTFEPGQASGSGTLASGYDLRLYVTQAGYQPPTLAVAAQMTLGGGYTVNLNSLPTGTGYVLHAHVLDHKGKDAVRMASGFFNVYGG